MSITRRHLFASGLPVALGSFAGNQALQNSEVSSATSGSLEIRSFEDFGAKGDYDLRSGEGTDDTQAIQQALDWAYNDAYGPARAIAAGSKTYLCGQITTYPYTTILGTGRQTSGFACKPGTTGAWWSDRGEGAQKLMLSGLAWYANHEPELTQICRFGRDGVQLGTESILQGLWLRDAPNAIALDISGNVAIVRDATLQDVDTGLKATGDANHLENIFAMQTRLGAHIQGSFVRGLHIEAPRSGGLPLHIRGNCRVSDAVFSLSAGSVFDHLIEIDTKDYVHWSFNGLQVFARDAKILKSTLKIGDRWVGGTDLRNVNGMHLQKKLEVHGQDLSMNGHRWRCFSIELRKARGRLSIAIRPSGGRDAARALQEFIPGAEAAIGKPAQPLGRGTAAEWLGDRLSFATKPLPHDGFGLMATVQRSSAGRQITVEASIGDNRDQRLELRFFDGTTGAPFDVSAMPEGSAIKVGVSGFGG